MIDMLVMRCPIKHIHETFYNSDGMPVVVETFKRDVSLADLKIPLIAAIDLDGNQVDLNHKWETLPSSYSNMAFKVFDFRDSPSDRDFEKFFIEIKASPAKLMQGHNVFGTDALWPCAEHLIHLLIDTYPNLIDFLDMKSWSVEQIDITYHSFCKSEHEAFQLVTALGNVSSGQTRARTTRPGTVYFGKQNSRIKKIKVYCKQLEMLNFMAKEKKAGDRRGLLKYYTDELVAFAKGMVRWESSIKTRWLERRGYSNNLFDLCKTFNAQEFWKESTLDIFKALEGKEMKMIKDENIEKQLKEKFPTVNPQSGKITYAKAINAYRVFRSIKSDGWIEAKRVTPNGSFFRAIDMLHECGLSKAVLQNLQGDGLKCEVIPFIRYIEINFNEQIPAFAKIAA